MRVSRRASPRALRALLRLLPRRFRLTYGADMEATFAARRADAGRRGRAAVAALWARTALNLAATAVRERRRSSFALHDGPVVSGARQDVTYAFRLLRRQPAYTLFVVLTLTAGVGTTTAVFSVVNGVVLRPLPYPDSDRLVTVWSRFVPESGFDYPEFPLSNPEFLDYREASRTLADVAAYSAGTATVIPEGAEPERVAVASVTTNVFDVLGTPVALGRGFTAADGLPGAPRVVVLGDGQWRTRFGADPGAVGRTMLVNGVSREIVGIARRGLAFPERATALWFPMTIDPANSGSRQSHYLYGIGRLRPGASLEQAGLELDVMMRQWKAQWPDIHTGHFLFVRSMRDEVVGPVEPILYSLLGATGFLLLIVCANVSSVVLARGEARTREMAVRTALGASRFRLVRLAVIESALLAGAGGLLGVGVAYLGVRALAAMEHSGVPRASEVVVDLPVLGFAAIAASASALVFGLVPALRGSASTPQAALGGGERTASAGASRLRFRRVLVAAEVALTVVLVVGAGLMARSLTRLMSVDPGFAPDGLLLGRVSLPASDYPDAERIELFYETLVTRLAAAPGVAGVSAGSAVPIVSSQGVWDFELDGVPQPAAGAPAWNAAIAFVRPGYFDLLGIPVVRGRAFEDTDDAGRQTVAIINQALADRFFPGEDPIGRRLRIAGDDGRPWSTIVGVAGSVRDQSLHEPVRSMYYMAHAQSAITAGTQTRSMDLIVRLAGPPETVVGSVRGVLAELDARLPFFRVQTYTEALADSTAQRRFATFLFGLFALIGLVLGATGIYGVLAYTVARRTKELGIRRALGAPSGGLIRLVAAQGFVPVAVGLAAGIAAARWMSRWIESQLFGIAATDLPTYALVAAGVLFVSAAACLVPARRALRVSPVTALRG
jgi:predicted permease